MRSRFVYGCTQIMECMDARERSRPSDKEEGQDFPTGTIEPGSESGRDAGATEDRGKPQAKTWELRALPIRATLW